jgi:CRP-like cAMP-binding protein
MSSTTFPSRSFPAGKVIFFEGQTSDTAYLIKTGRIEISRKQANQKIILDVLTAPEIFGEMAFINNEPRSATAEALEDSELIVIQRDQLEQYLNQSPVVVRALIRCLSQRLKSTSSYVHNVGSENSLSRLCYVLSLMEPSYPSNSTPSKRQVNIPYEKAVKHLTKSLNFSVHHTKGILEKISDLGLVQFEIIDNEKYIIILDKSTFVEQARTLGSANFSASEQTTDSYITIMELAQVLQTETAEIRERLSTGIIPDSLVYFYKPDLFRWIDEI